MYNPQIQIFAKSETKRHFFECSFKTKRSKKDLHTTQTIKPEIRAKNNSIPGFVKSYLTGNITAFKPCSSSIVTNAFILLFI